MINLLEITKIKGNRYLLKVEKDKTLTKHIVSENIIIKYNLLNPKELNNVEYKAISKTNIEDDLYEKALVFIDFKMRSISEVKKRLLKEVKDEELINKIIKRLKTNKYLDDTLYVKSYIDEKIDFDLVGPRYIKEKLILKGIHYDLINQYLEKYKDELQYDKIFEIIKNETKFKIKKPYKKAYLAIKQKLVNKGFSFNIIESSLISNKEEIKMMIDDLPILKNEISKLLKKYDINIYEQKNKVIKSLLSKGFDYDLIKRNLKEGEFIE